MGAGGRQPGDGGGGGRPPMSSRAMPVLAQPKAGTHEHHQRLPRCGGAVAAFLKRWRSRVPVFACGVTGITPAGGVYAPTASFASTFSQSFHSRLASAFAGPTDASL